jgi:hypothetical protein
MTIGRVVLDSLSAAMDGGFTAITDVSTAMTAAGTAGGYRLIGGVAVMLHVQRLGLDLPLRATGDADFGVPPHLLRRPELVQAIEALGYDKAFGNRWERAIDERRVAAVDLLVPAYRSRARPTVKVGDVVTTEVPGLAEALRRPGVTIDAELRLTDGTVLTTTVVLPDAIGTLALKAGVPGWSFPPDAHPRSPAGASRATPHPHPGIAGRDRRHPRIRVAATTPPAPCGSSPHP